jgi:hypothetical protein
VDLGELGWGELSTVLVWLRIGTIRELLWTSGFHRMLGTSRVAARLEQSSAPELAESGY